jgi:hypothetical protein
MKYRIKEGDWSKIYFCLRKIEGIYTGNEMKTRRFFEAVFFINTGLTHEHAKTPYKLYQNA